MNPPRILLVDDQRQVSRVLRSSLELSGREYFIQEVSSAEEALAEIERAPIDLLVTDLRLPAMSGIELVEQAKRKLPNLHTILISGDASDAVRQRGEQLGVLAFLQKPIGTNYFLEIVETALEVAREQVEAEVQESVERLRERLADLRRQVGAEAVILVNGKAEVQAQVGDPGPFNVGDSLKPLLQAHQASMAISENLGQLTPANFHHVQGSAVDLYITNVDESHALVIVHHGSEEAGQLGSVMHYGRRAADVLEVLLGDETVERPSAAAAIDWEEVEVDGDKNEKEMEGDALEDAAKQVDAGGADDFWEKASEKPMKPDSDDDSLTYEQAQELGLLEDD